MNHKRSKNLRLAGILLDSGLYDTRLHSLATIRQISHYAQPYNIYAMDICYKYDLDRLIDRGLDDNQKNIDAILKEALPLVPVAIHAPDFSCSAFALKEKSCVLMGRNYDFRFNTSAMMVHCTPSDGYESISFCALDNLSANEPFLSIKNRFASLASPFIILDGINEKGVSMAVLILDSAPTNHHTGKPIISTSIAIRLVLDRAATTQEAVDLLAKYDMFAASGRDYHFYITDAAGDGRAVEYDCNSENREMKAVPIRQITNFFALYKDQVKPNQKNGIYGHGKERYDAMEKILDTADRNSDMKALAWQALQAASQDPDPLDMTSNTQWSIIYDNKNCTADIVLRRAWTDIYHFDIHGNCTEQIG